MTYLESTTPLQRLQDLRDAHFLNGPEHFDMEHWARRLADEDEDDGDETSYGDSFNWDETGAFYRSFPLNEIESGFDINACGSTCCLAGNAQLIAKLELEDGYGMGGRLMAAIQISEAFDLPYEIFSGASWNKVLYNGISLSLLYRQHREHHNPQAAEWHTILDYLDWRIKEALNAS